MLGDTLFSSPRFPDERRAWLFTLCAHKLLFLLHENQGGGLNDLYCSAALYRMYQFIVRYETDNGPFPFRQRQRVAFFPGTFDPFTLSHKALACTIRDMGYEVFLAVDEFSWSKKTQPSLIDVYKRQRIDFLLAPLPLMLSTVDTEALFGGGVRTPRRTVDAKHLLRTSQRQRRRSRDDPFNRSTRKILRERVV